MKVEGSDALNLSQLSNHLSEGTNGNYGRSPVLGCLHSSDEGEFRLPAVFVVFLRESECGLCHEMGNGMFMFVI